jgi:hypothetical protein
MYAYINTYVYSYVPGGTNLCLEKKSGNPGGAMRARTKISRMGTYVCIYVCMYVCMYVCTKLFMYSSIYLCTYIYIFIYKYTYIPLLHHEMFERMNMHAFDIPTNCSPK